MRHLLILGILSVREHPAQSPACFVRTLISLSLLRRRSHSASEPNPDRGATVSGAILLLAYVSF
jgi:hypothetical protein